MDPYLRGSIVAYPFSWMEASYQYVDINNQLYSDIFSFSGNQTFKDKSFDFKFLLLKERNNIPALALGLRDAAGTGLFASEYLVMSKNIGIADFSLGMGWGKLTNGKSISNPFTNINDSFKIGLMLKELRGEFTFGSFFSGNSSLFGGLELKIPYANGLRFKYEYDATDYNKEGFPPVAQKSKNNFSFIYTINNYFHLKLVFFRGNTLNLGFSFTGNYRNKNSFIRKSDFHKPVTYKDEYKELNTEDERTYYKTVLQTLKDRELYLQTANINKEESKFSVSYSQSKYISYTRALGRISRVLDEISPEYIEKFEIINLNTSLPMHKVNIEREQFVKYDPINIKNLQVRKENISRADYSYTKHEYQPRLILPRFITKVAPRVRSPIGGPDGFYFGDIRLGLKSEIILRRNLSILVNASAGIYDNFDELKLASDSILPHVRTDIVKYLKQSKHLSLDQAQINYFTKISDDSYARISAGYLESMFGGIGAEYLYRPFNQQFAIGAELFHLKQREYKQRLRFRDYDTNSGFINFYYHEPRSNILLKIKGGKFLAKDSGIKFDFSRHFKSGARMGVFFTFTDISREEFGEGSFDKGFYFNIPIESFSDTYSRGYTGFGLRPVTRDGGAHIIQNYNLYGVTEAGTEYSILRDWDDIYE